MIKLGKDPVKVPPVHAAGKGALSANSVYVLEKVGDAPTPQLAEGTEAVLTRGSGTAELTTRSTMGGNVDQPGTYLTPEDAAALGGDGTPMLRKYGWTDTWRKIWSRGGRRFLLATFVAVATTLVGAWFLFEGDQGTSAAEVATRAQTALAWAATPADQLGAAGADAATVRQELARREREVSRCLAQLRGDDVPKATVEGVKCDVTTTPWLKDKDNEATVTTVLGLITVVLTATGLGAKFGFGKDPGEA